VELFSIVWGENIVSIILDNKGPHEANFLKLDCSKAKTVLQWKPIWDIKTAVKKLLSLSKPILIVNGRIALNGRFRNILTKAGVKSV
jgi:CDP-glucose 4,6-dehydratase